MPNMRCYFYATLRGFFLWLAHLLQHGGPVVRLAEEGEPLDAEHLELHLEFAVDVADVGVGHQGVDVALGVGRHPLELVRIKEVDAEHGAIPALSILGNMGFISVDIVIRI